MDNNTSYETQAIDLNLLSMLDITKEGKVVSAEKWVELWNLVFQHINKIDAFCVDMQSTLDNWHESEIALNEIIEDMQMKYNALSTEFIHYGENTPENPHIMLWVRRMNDVSTHGFLTNEDVDSELSSTSENPVQNKVINTALSNKMNKNNPTGTGSFSLNRRANTTVGSNSHAEGYNAEASGSVSHAEGSNTKASSDYQHVQGKYNIPDSNNIYADVIGNGYSDAERSNAHTLDWRGNAWYAGDVYVGSTSGTNKDEGSKKLATEEYADTQITKKTDQTYSPTSVNAQSGKAVAEALSGYVMAEVGKGLSSNDFTNEDKEKLYSALQNEDIAKNYNPTSENAQSGKAVAEAIAQNTYTKISKIEISVDDFSQFDTSKVYIAANDIQIREKLSEPLVGWVCANKILKDSLITFDRNSDILTVRATGRILNLVNDKLHCNADFSISLSSNAVKLKGINYFNPLSTDSTYDANSDNPQSGKAVAEAVSAEQNRANSTFSNALKGSKSGSAILIDDISPVTHEMGVKISSNTVTDLTAVKVSRCGKNLLNLQGRTDAQPTGNWPISKYDVGHVIYRGFAYSGYYQTSEDYKCDVNVDGSTITVIQKVDNYGVGYLIKCRPNTQYIFSATTDLNEFYAMFIDKDGNQIDVENWSKNFTTTSDTEYIIICLWNSTAGTFTIENPQLELGSTATEYEPYKECAEYTPAADGTVNGVTSLYPNTTLMTDTDGVLIDCKYNKDINKAFAEMQAALISLGGTI